MEEAFRAYLIGWAGLAELIRDGVYWGARPQGSPLPAVVLTLVSAPDDLTLNGPSGFVGARVQVDCWADSYLAARDVGDALRAAAAGIAGTRDGWRFDSAPVAGAADGHEVVDGGLIKFRRRVDLTLWHAKA